MDLILSYKSETVYIVYIHFVAISKPFVVDFNIWHDSIYCMSKVFPSATPTLGHGFEAQVTDLYYLLIKTLISLVCISEIQTDRCPVVQSA